MPFTEDLKLGNKYEKKALDYIKYDEYEIKKGCFKEYDLITTYRDKQTYYEVKCDRLAHRTGNIAIEYECNKKPSGITSSTADFWIYFIINKKNHTYNTRLSKDEVYIIPKSYIKEIMTKFRSVSGGDGWRSKMYLIPKKEFKRYLYLKTCLTK